MIISDKYELIEERKVEELYSNGYLLRHKRSGARVFLLENDDENKVFYIGFRTPPPDSTGVPHIMEHSVLCGSKLFPAKDPFIELAKGSLNTFLNAMTYPDKTVYPVASCNDRDFKNLMHVYMDAVFAPNIYTREEIFCQEGWHYELSDPEGEVEINGVVYNEMKGAFSSPEDTIDRKMFEVLYPDTAYAREAGGDPDYIPELTYEAFLDFHRKYYHPSNSYIYIYGNCDMQERLEWLDSEYLKNYETIEVDSAPRLQKPLDTPAEKEIEYGITEEEETQDNTYIECSWVVDTVLNRELYLAFQIVDYVLLSAPGAPLKEKLLRSGICSDVMSSYENGVLQPYFSIMIKNTNASEKERFVSMVRETLEEIVEKGVDKKSLEAGINYFEFKYREADFGAYPKGLMYGLQCLDSWLYDDKDPFMHISATETIEFLKEKAATGYFEEIIRKYLIDNNHSAVIVSVPRKGLTAKKEAALASKMEEYKAGLSDTQIKELAKKTAALKKYQEEPSTPEELASIPMLKVSDIEKKAKPIDNELIEKDGVRYLYHDVNTNGISYLTLLFDIRSIPMELACYAALLRSLYGMVSTERYSYFDLANEINSKTGGITVTQSVYNREDMIVPAIEVDAKMLMDRTDFAFDMIEEIIFSSKLDEYVRIKEMLQMMKSRMQMAMLSSGHSMASKRAMGYFSDSSLYEDMTGGYEFYRFIDGLLEDFDNKKQELTEKFTQVIPMIFGRDNLIVSIGGSREALKKVMDRIPAFMEKLSDAPHPATKIELPHEKKNEGFKSSSMVQYAAMAGNFKAAGLEYNGALRVLKTILGYDYLWINVRVKGGAYGCMSGFGRNGDSFMVSYRDPNIGKTYDVYKNAASYVENFDASDRDMSKYIIGTMAVVDTPLTPKMRCDRGLAQFVVGRSFESIQKERDEILSTDKETVRSLAPYVRALTDPGYICVVGGEERINEEKELFNTVKNLF